MKKKIWYSLIDCDAPSPALPQVEHVFQSRISPPFKHIRGIDRRDEGFVYKLTLSGYGWFKSRGKLHCLEPGSLLFCRVNDPDIEYFVGEKPWEFIFTSMSGSSLLPLGNEIIANYGHVFNDLPHEKIEQILSSFRKPKNASTQMPYADNVQLLNKLLDFLIRDKRDDENLSLVQQAQKLINTSSLQALNVASLAKQLNISREHLSREFQQEMGIGPHQAITTVRLEKACHLLRSTDLEVSEIAFECGVAAESFSAWFRRQQGSSPGKFRKA